MSRIDDLLAELCPDGVEFAPLGSLVRIRNGRDYKSLEAGDVPVYGTGGVMLHVGTAAHPGPSVLIPRKGSLANLYYVDTPFWTVDTIFYTEIGPRLEPRFLYHFLLAQRLQELNQAGGVPSLTQGVLNALPIPVPPRPIQQEIVRVLDAFSKLETELEAELEARRHQYAHYRDFLMSFSDSVVRKPLGALGAFFGGLTGKSKRDFEKGNARFASYKNVFNNPALDASAEDFVVVRVGERQRQLAHGDVIFTGSSETRDEVGMSSVITTQLSEAMYLNSFCIGFRPRHPGYLDPEFAKHLFRSAAMRDQIILTASGVTRINVSKARLAQVQVPLPSREEQRVIVRALDSLHALANDLIVGLPAELAARRKQYEYYRDKLLTFEELTA